MAPGHLHLGRLLNPEPEPIRRSLAGDQRVDGPLHVLALIQLLIQPDQDHAQDRGRADGNKRRHAVDGHGHRVPRVGAARVHVAGVDAAAVADGVDEGQGGGALGGRARERVADPGEADDEARVDGGDLVGSRTAQNGGALKGEEGKREKEREGEGWEANTYHEHHAEVARG